MKTLLIKNADLIVTMDSRNTMVRNADIFIEGPAISAIGRNLRRRAQRTIRAEGMVVYPGFVNTHHHLYQTLTRNIPAVNNAKLFDWLTLLYGIWRELTPGAVYTSALTGMSELLLTGCTTTTDHLYLFPQSQPKDLIDHEIRAARDIGIRFAPTRGSMTRGKSKGGLPPDDVCQTEEEVLKDSERLIRKYHDAKKYSMLKIGLGPCSPFSITTELLKETAALGKKYGVRCHTHIAETKDEDEFCKQTLGMRPVEYMESCGWLGREFWYAHCVHLNSDEIGLLARTKTGVAHCPVSNLRLGSGIAPVAEMLERGVPVGLAVDGSASNDSSNFLFEMKTALLVHRIKSGPGSMSASRVLSMATRGGASVLGFDEIGSLEPGQAADLALFSLDHIGYAGALHDRSSAVLYAGDSQITAYTIVNGSVVAEKGRIVKIDMKKLVKKQNSTASDMLARAAERTGIRYL